MPYAMTWPQPEAEGSGKRPQAGHLQTGRLVDVSGSDGILPDIGDLAASLRFSLRDGRIWLDTQRVALIHLSTLSSLRRELIDSLGLQEARGFLTRMGYASGSRDAALARKLRPHQRMRDAFLVGPQLRILQGVGAMEPVRLEADVRTGRYYGEFIWSESFEVDAYLSCYGVANSPVCWMQLGYACGYTSSFMGRTIIYREVECRATGSTVCRVIGKPLEEWDDIEEELRALQPQNFANQFTARRRADAVSTIPGAAGENSQPLYEDMLGVSSGFVSACHMLKKVASTNATVLFLGETGVGKEMFARTLHRISDRAEGPFVAVNCTAIPDNLIEAELFGVERGAYTGASQSRPGRFERADGGTLFLDEVGALSMSAQVKLLRAIQEREIERVGDTRSRSVDVRIVAATNVDLKQAVKAGDFRGDLLFRLNVFPIRIPPLRQRRDDIPLLMDHFLHKFCTLHKRRVTGFTERAVDALYQYDYPGNIRELENLIERAVILADDEGPIDLGHLFASEDALMPRILKLDPGASCLRDTGDDKAAADGTQARLDTLLDSLLENATPLTEVENTLMREAVVRAGGNLSEAARMLGLSRAQLAYRLKKQGIGEE